MSEPPRVTGRVPVTITHLERLEPPRGAPVQPPMPGLEVVRALHPTLSFYRYLYDAVGGPWVWTKRRLMAEDELRAIIEDERVDIRVLWRPGVPAGYAELDFCGGDDVELAYFGLLPAFIGQRLGRYLLDWSVRHAFFKGARRLWVHTCDLDHPRALDAYIEAGFEPFDREEGEELLIEGMALPAHAADRTVRPA